MSLPEGHYTNVYVHGIQTGGTQLRNGTGTMSATGVFSCGNFSPDDYPEVGMYYNITGYMGGSRHEAPMRCIGTGGQTCDFQES